MKNSKIEIGKSIPATEFESYDLSYNLPHHVVLRGAAIIFSEKQQYDLLLKIDEIAERILTLGHTPEHSYSAYYKVSTVKETAKVSDGKVAVSNILDSFKTVIMLQREILDLSDEANDEGTNSLMSDYISLQEKDVWMYSSFMNN